MATNRALAVELRKVRDIHPYAQNPRKNEAAAAAVAESIRQFGFRQPILVDEQGVIVCGHTRWKAAQQLRIVFLPEYCATLAQQLISACDVSNQISTAGYEASGTSNMKFMMNGALTIGTRDGATIEMAEEAGEENFFLLGLTAQQVADSRSWYNPRWHYDHEPETRAALDLIFSDHFSRYEPGVLAPLRDTLLTNGDHYMHLADLRSYLEADQRLLQAYADSDSWARKVILNVAASGKFSSDRTIAEYAADIWNVEPCPVP
jgi:starch phosphorylase